MDLIDIVPLEDTAQRTWSESPRNGSGKRVWYTLYDQLGDTKLPTPGSSKFSDWTELTGKGHYTDRLICTERTFVGVSAAGKMTIGGIEVNVPWVAVKVTATYGQGNSFSSAGSKYSCRSRIMPVPVGGVDGNGNPILDTVPRIITEGCKSVTMCYPYNALRESSLDSKAGCINANPCTINGKIYPAETVRFDEFDIDPLAKSSDNTAMDIVHFRFAIQKYGWNNIFVNGVWQPAVNQIYPLADFNMLVPGGM